MSREIKDEYLEGIMSKLDKTKVKEVGTEEEIRDVRDSKSKKLNYINEKQSHTSILNIALDVHMVATGSGGWYKTYFRDVSFLRYVISTWNYCNKYTGFDSAVKQVVEEALKDHDVFVTLSSDLSKLHTEMCEDPEYFLRIKEK